MRPRRLALVATGLLLALMPAAAAADTTFQGPGTLWQDAANWSLGVPDAADQVIINPSQNPVISTAAANAKGIALPSTASLTVIGGQMLTLATTGVSSFAGLIQVDSGATLQLAGAGTWSAGDWYVGNGGGTVANGGSLTVTGDASVFNQGSGMVHNLAAGTITRTTSTGTANWGAGVDNDGTISVLSGVLALSGGSGGAVSDGDFDPQGAGILAVNGAHDLGTAGGTTSNGSSTGTLRLDGGTFSVAGIDTYNLAGTTLASGGYLSVAGSGHDTGAFASDGTGGGRSGTGTLTVGGGASSLNSVEFAGSGTTIFAPAASYTATGLLQVYSGATLQLGGAGTWSGGDWYVGNGGGTVANGGSLTVTGDASVFNQGSGMVHNLAAGTITRTTSTGTANWGAGVDNDGTISVLSGVLALSGGSGGASSDGDFDPQGAGILAVNGAHDLGTAGGTTSNGSSTGTLRLDGGTFSVAGIDTYNLAGTTLASGGYLSVAGSGHDTGAFASDGTGGGRSGTGTLTVGGGASSLNSVEFAGSGTTIFAPAASYTATGLLQVYSGATLQLGGAGTWSGGDWYVGNGGGTVANGGSLTVTGDASVFNQGSGMVHNLAAGTITRTTSTGTANWGAGVDNDGTISVLSGVLALSGGSGGASSDGMFAPQGAGVLAVSGTHDLGPTGGATGTGTMRFDGGTFSVAGTDTYNLAGTTLASGGYLSVAGSGHDTGAFASDGTGGGRSGTGTLTVGGGASSLNSVEFAGSGTTIFAPAASYTATGLLQVYSGATLQLGGAGTWSGGDWYVGNGGGTVANGGSLTVTGDASVFNQGSGMVHNLAAGTITRTGSNNTVSIGTPLANSGTLNVSSGTVAYSSASQDAGTINVAGPATFGSSGSTLTLSGGALTGTGTLAGNVDNNGGTIRPGTSPGILTINQDFTQNTGGTLEVEIAGATAGTGHDRLAVGGIATLGGTLAIVTPGPFDPLAASTYDVFTAPTALSGTFFSITGAQFNGKHYEPEYQADRVRLHVVADPLPPAPQNTTLPSIPASAQTGDTLTCSPGQWTGSPTFLYAWLRDGTPIAGATNSTYAVTGEDVGHALACQVTGSNAGGSAAATSNAVTPTAPEPLPAPGPTTTPAPTPTPTPAPASGPGSDKPSPELGSTVVVAPESGTVRIKLPGSGRFVELKAGEEIPVGAVVDTTAGRVALTSVAPAGNTQTASFYDGQFVVLQAKTPGAVTELRLAGPTCQPNGKASTSARRKRKRRLWGDGKGRFRTRGKYGTATVQGTKWLTEDRCDGTFFQVRTGRVRVEDLVRRRKITVGAGRSYLARAPR